MQPGAEPVQLPVGFILKLSSDGSQLDFSSLIGGSDATGADQVKLNPVTGDLDVVGATNASQLHSCTEHTADGVRGGNMRPRAVFQRIPVGLDPTAGSIPLRHVPGRNGKWLDRRAGIRSQREHRCRRRHAVGFVEQRRRRDADLRTRGRRDGRGAETFVAKLNLSGTSLTPGFLTLIQADADTGPASISTDSSGNIYFAGATAGTHLPVTAQAYQSANTSTFGNTCGWVGVLAAYLLPNACGTGVVGKLGATGTLSFLTYLGGNTQDMAEAIGVDSNENVWIAGVTSSSNFPVSPGASSYYGTLIPFLAEMSSDGTQLPFATDMAGPYGQSSDLAIDSQNNIYVTGFYGSNGLGFTEVAQSTPGTYPTNTGAYSPVFLEKWSASGGPILSLTPGNSLAFGDTAVGSASPAQALTLQNTGAGAMELGLAFTSNSGNSSDFLVSSNCGTSLAAGATCTITIVFAPARRRHRARSTVRREVRGW